MGWYSKHEWQALIFTINSHDCVDSTWKCSKWAVRFFFSLWGDNRLTENKRRKLWGKVSKGLEGKKRDRGKKNVDCQPLFLFFSFLVFSSLFVTSAPSLCACSALSSLTGTSADQHYLNSTHGSNARFSLLSYFRSKWVSLAHHNSNSRPKASLF